MMDLEMSHLGPLIVERPGPSQRPPRQKRKNLNFLKCQLCREKKQKCLPDERTWPRRCDRCIQHNFPCSEPRRARPTLNRLNKVSKRKMGVQEYRRDWFGEAHSTSTCPRTSPVLTDRPLPIVAFQCYMKRARAADKSELFKAIDFYVSIRKIIGIAIGQLKTLADAMAKPYENDPVWIEHAKCLDNAFVKLDGFAEFLMKRQLDDVGYESFWFSEPNSNLCVGRRVSGIADENMMKSISTHVSIFREDGFPGLALLLKLEQIMRYPDHLNEFDWKQLDGCEIQFYAQSMRRLLDPDIEEHVPQQVKQMSLILPGINLESFRNHECIAHQLLYRGATMRHSSKQDCLGRSPSHILADAGIRTSWQVDSMNHSDVLGRIALYFASRNGDESAVRRLLECGANIDSRTVTGLSPLHVAATMGYTSICRLIWERHWSQGSFAHAELDCARRTHLLCAASAGHPETVKFFCDELKKIGFPLDDTDQEGSSALGLAASGGHLDVVHVLLKYNLTVDLPDRLGRTPFWHATKGSHYDIARVLAPFANVDCKDNEGHTPLAEAARSGNVESIKLLLGLNTQVSQQSPGPHDHLKNIRVGNLKGLPSDAVVNLSSKNKNGKSPLILATEASHVECVRLLLNYRPRAFSLQEAAYAGAIAETRQNAEVIDAIKCYRTPRWSDSIRDLYFRR